MSKLRAIDVLVSQAENELSVAETALWLANSAIQDQDFDNSVGYVLNKPYKCDVSKYSAVIDAEERVAELKIEVRQLRQKQMEMAEERYLEEVAEARSEATRDGFVAGPESRWVRILTTGKKGPTLSVLTGRYVRESVDLSKENLRDMREWLNSQDLD